MKKCRNSRPYLKCRLKFDWHIKPYDTSSQFLETLAEFLVEKGFKRTGKIKRSHKKQSVFGSCDPERTEGRDVSKEDNDVDKTNSETPRKVIISFFS